VWEEKKGRIEKKVFLVVFTQRWAINGEKTLFHRMKKEEFIILVEDVLSKQTAKKNNHARKKTRGGSIPEKGEIGKKKP